MILRLPGSKIKAARDLLSYAPAGFREYREPFAGNASMLWVIPTDVERWINDIDPDVTRFLRSLKSREFCESVIALRNQYADADVDSVLREFRLSRLRFAEGDPLARWFLSRFAHGCFVGRQRRDIAAFGWHRRTNGIHPITPEMVWDAHERMKGVRVTTGNYAELLDAPGADVWLLIDPPYLIEHHQSSLYPFDFTIEDHHELAERLRACRHKWLLTINHCVLTQQLYAEGEYNIYFREYLYSNRPGARPTIHELIVTNY